MAPPGVQRLPATRTLYDILPKGTEGGKEFARIVDLLLLHDARRRAENITLFSDAAGDYHALDIFQRGPRDKPGVTGYQCKFYPSPLSADHRAAIKKALADAAQANPDLVKWVIITPQDLLESASRRDGGDVAWLEGLRADYRFEIEHWGHRRLQALFLETPTLCLYYYPELLPQGGARRHTIQATRTRYNSNMLDLHRRIEFVGMSVYKPEATRGVPMEHIYIPLKAIPDGSDATAAETARKDPLTFLAPGRWTMVLGDPGSGKSVLLRFLALAGLSTSLQQRYAAAADTRLPILVVLRRYADELKQRRNLPLLDYIVETVQADFSLNAADTEFFEYYLESGQAVLLFDGLDELPDAEFRRVVRDRIHALLTTYPGNTAIVTSRIVGYEGPYRFDPKEFRHYRLSPLDTAEMEQFVGDWYRVRVENARERKDAVDDLVRILRDEAHAAIHELARNPLLLTIVALVHRIDAVLPDERVVLYQKCTETLLNTWNAWKYRAGDAQRRGKVERRNRKRMEAIAHWMQAQARATGREQRAMVGAEDLHRFLADHIGSREHVREGDEDPADQAEEFLDFVRKKAGLLVEVGDAAYSFVHLTFQEYLAASHIAAESEQGGREAVWAAISDRLCDPAWHEVIRLLVAALKSNETQGFVVERVLASADADPGACRARLLGGFLLDGIDEAEEQIGRVCECLLRGAATTDDRDVLRSALPALRFCAGRDDKRTREATLSAIDRVWDETGTDAGRAALMLTLLASGWRFDALEARQPSFLAGAAGQPLRWFFAPAGDPASGPAALPGRWSAFVRTMQAAACTNPIGNLMAAMAPAIALPFGRRAAARAAFEVLAAALAGSTQGPSTHVVWHSFLLASSRDAGPIKLAEKLARRQPHGQGHDSRDAGPWRQLHALLGGSANGPAWGRTPDRFSGSLGSLPARSDMAHEAWSASIRRAREHAEAFWATVIATPSVQEFFAEAICRSFGLEPRAHWELALRAVFLPEIPRRMTLLDADVRRELEDAARRSRLDEAGGWTAAWLLLVDAVLLLTGVYRNASESAYTPLAKAARASAFPALRVARHVRDFVYGNASAGTALTALRAGSDPEMERLFLDCGWTVPAEAGGPPPPTT